MRSKSRALKLFGAAAAGLVLPSVALATSSEGVDLGKALPLWSIAPFVGILLSIAVLPLLTERFWRHNYGKVTAFWAVAAAIPLSLAFGAEVVHEVERVLVLDYVPFLILLWSLFTVSGGLVLRGAPRGTPLVNTAMLAIGTLLASCVGTTGASMLLIRPVLRANCHRRRVAHIVVFFIFLVSNIGGSLTPLGDPPLFLGFLHGVPFFWTLEVFPQMAFVSLLVLGVFFLLDSLIHRREAGTMRDPQPDQPLQIDGLRNGLFLLGIVMAVLVSGLVKLGHIDLGGIRMEIQNILRDLFLIVMGLLSLKLTPHSLRDENAFSWGPIKEVAYLFAGIFVCITPALAILRAGSEGALAPVVALAREPWHYFWIVGGLSSFLDNAPTYLTFLSTVLGQLYPGIPEREAILTLVAHPQNRFFLQAVAAGAVFMGANTYIGNAPNFMVKSIAEDFAISMPSFFGYMAYSVGILVPVFILSTLVFF